MQNKKQAYKVVASKNPSDTMLLLLKTIGGALLVYAGSKITIPLQPVPVTLQTFAVLLVAMTYGRGESLAAILAYVGLGVMGAPMFAGGLSGPAVLLGSTGGYIIGFIIASLAIGWLKDGWFKQYLASNNMVTKFLAAVLLAMVGLTAIFAPGVIWLSHLIGLEKSIAFGLLPFVLPEMVKAVILSLALRAVGFFK